MPDTLLLADDSATIQRVIEMTFADEDVRVVAVGDGREAIECIAADPPDIVLADTDMPEKDGYDVSAFVKADRALSHIPVVLLTGAFDPVDGERAREVGCDAVLVKPFEPKALISRVRELLGTPAADADDGSPVGAAGSSAPEEDAAAGDGSPEPAGEAAPPAPSSAEADASPAATSASLADTPAKESAPPAAEGASSAAEGASPAAESASSAMEAASSATEAASPAMEAASPAMEAASPAAEAAPLAPTDGGGAADATPSTVPADATPSAVPAVEAPAPPTLADAFASILAAEQGDLDRARTAYPWRQAAPAGDEDLVERVAERVIERLSDEVTEELVSEVVARVAERLVRDQIGRVKPD